MAIIRENVLLAPYTVFKIGGPARFFVEISNFNELKEALDFARHKGIPFFILGAGSNVLISDKGFDGMAIKINMRGLDLAGSMELAAESGVSVAKAVLKAAQAGLGGFEWGIGVPGTIGGSIRGNAGCFGGEMKDVVESVSVFDVKKAASYKLQATSCDFGYRDSIFKRHPEWVILSATLRLRPGDPKKIQENIRRISKERTEKQDIGAKSAGCIFKNVSWTRKDINRDKLLSHFPELAEFKNSPNIPASFLIDQAGLKGKRVGHVYISKKHANYFVNENGAIAEEVVMLTAITKDVVGRKHGILLEEEIQYVGF